MKGQLFGIAFLISTLTFLLLLLSAIFDFALYRAIFTRIGVYQTVGNPLLVDSVGQNIIDYFQNRSALSSVLLSPQAVTHLADVRMLIYLTCAATIGLIVWLTWLLSSKKRHALIGKSLLISAVLNLAIMAALLIITTTSFAEGFVLFHQLVFRNTLWLFPPNDLLIQLFPEQFFVAFLTSVLHTYAITAAILGLLGYVIIKIQKPSSPARP